MSTTVQSLITGARAKLNDGYADHFSNDDLTRQIPNTATPPNLFKLNNRNVVQVADGSPKDFAVYVDGIAVVAGQFTLDKVAGTVTLTTAPAFGKRVTALYYFVLVPDADYIGFCREGAAFVGVVPTFTAVGDTVNFDDLLVNAVEHYMAWHAAEKMANLTSWYYSANAGNKSFDKNKIASNFRTASKQLSDEAVELRDDVYKRHGQRNAPSLNQSAYTTSPYAPKR